MYPLMFPQSDIILRESFKTISRGVVARSRNRVDLIFVFYDYHCKLAALTVSYELYHPKPKVAVSLLCELLQIRRDITLALW